MLNSRIKKYLILLLLVFCFIRVDALIKPTKDFYVNDYDNVLNYNTKNYINTRSAELDRISKIQIVVATIKDMEGKSIEEYANEVYNTFGIGYESKGILILLCRNERKVRIEVGDGLGGIIPDGKAGRILDNYAVPYLKNYEWNKGIKNTYDAIYKIIIEEYNLHLDYDEPKEHKKTDNVIVDSNAKSFAYSALFGFIFGIIMNFIVFGSSAKKRLIFAFIYVLIFIGIRFICNKYKIDFILQFLEVTNLLAYFISLYNTTLVLEGSRYGGGRFGGKRGFGGGRSSSGGGGHSSGGGASRGF